MSKLIGDLIIFMVGSKYFAVMGQEVIGITEEAQLLTHPTTPDYIEGLVRDNGVYVSAMNSRHCLGVKDGKPTGKSTFLEIKSEDDLRVGILVDKIVTFMSLNSAQMITKEDGNEKFVIYKPSGGHYTERVPVINFPSLVTTEVREYIARQ